MLSSFDGIIYHFILIQAFQKSHVIPMIIICGVNCDHSVIQLKLEMTGKHLPWFSLMSPSLVLEFHSESIQVFSCFFDKFFLTTCGFSSQVLQVRIRQFSHGEGGKNRSEGIVNLFKKTIIRIIKTNFNKEKNSDEKLR